MQLVHLLLDCGMTTASKEFQAGFVEPASTLARLRMPGETLDTFLDAQSEAGNRLRLVLREVVQGRDSPQGLLAPLELSEERFRSVHSLSALEHLQRLSAQTDLQQADLLAIRVPRILAEIEFGARDVVIDVFCAVEARAGDSRRGEISDGVDERVYCLCSRVAGAALVSLMTVSLDA